MEVQIFFSDPLNASTGDGTDVLVMEIDFSGIDVTAKQSFRMQKKIPVQMELGSAAETLQQTVEAAESVTTAATVGATISQLLMTGALTQLWGMINGLQIFVHLPLFSI